MSANPMTPRCEGTQHVFIAPSAYCVCGAHRDEPPDVNAPRNVACYDCGLEYDDDGWIECVVPNDVWLKIGPFGHEGGLLCITCIARRIKRLGLGRVYVKLTGTEPIRVANDNADCPHGRTDACLYCAASSSSTPLSVSDAVDARRWRTIRELLHVVSTRPGRGYYVTSDELPDHIRLASFSPESFADAAASLAPLSEPTSEGTR